MPRSLVFDLDNTLLHSRINFAAIRHDIVDLWHHQSITTQSLDELRKISIGQIIELAQPHDEKYKTDLVATAWQIVLDYERLGMSVATIEPDAVSTLKKLADDGHFLAILTNNARLATLEALDKFELRTYFDLILTRDEVKMKPEPDGLLEAQQYGVEQRGLRDTPLMIGDSWLDGLAAQRAAVPFLAFRPQVDSFANHSVQIWRTIENLAEIPSLLSNSTE